MRDKGEVWRRGWGVEERKMERCRKGKEDRQEEEATEKEMRERGDTVGQSLHPGREETKGATRSPHKRSANKPPCAR